MSYASDLPPGCKRQARGSYAPKISKQGNRVTATDYWMVPFASMTEALTVINGKAEDVGGALVRVVPLRFADYPDYLVQTNFDVEYVGWDENGVPFEATAPAAGGYFKRIRVRVDYAAPDFDLDGTRAFQSVSIRGAERSMRAVSTAFQTSGGNSPAHSPDVLVPGYDYTITLHRLAGDNAAPAGIDPYLAAQGSVNDSLYRGIPAGCLLYRTIEATPEPLGNGLTAWDVTFLMSASLRPWNHEFLSDGTVSEVLLGGSTRRYPFINFFNYFN